MWTMDCGLRQWTFKSFHNYEDTVWTNACHILHLLNFNNFSNFAHFCPSQNTCTCRIFFSKSLNVLIFKFSYKAEQCL